MFYHKCRYFVVIIIITVFLAISCMAYAADNNKPYDGKEINVLLLRLDNFTYLLDLLNDFEEETGITVNVDLLPEKTIMPKVTMNFASGSDEYDVVSVGNRSIPQFVRGDWLMPIDDYMNDPTLTKSDYDSKDIIPALLDCMSVDGVLYGVPQNPFVYGLMYNKKMFEEAGIDSPPQNLEELERYAKLLTTPDHAGIALRATREAALGAVTWLALWYKMGGHWFDQDMKPLLDSPASIETTNYWARILNNYAPKGVSGYSWNEVILAMQNAEVAMVIDDFMFGPKLEDPDNSLIAGNVGYHVIEGPSDKYTIAGAWGFVIPKASKEPEAAWQFIQFATGKKSNFYAVENGLGGGVVRESAWTSDQMARDYNKEWASAMLKGLSHAQPNYTPLIPEGPRLRDELSVAITSVLAGDSDAEQAMKKANEACYNVLKDAGYYDK
ncbi:MAG TPA: sugar ABC transporter substrate-binding protein [Atribacterota bacterium]|nr:sugar ABC transporter substrate-binding protein [Atribacterota bacterium]